MKATIYLNRIKVPFIEDFEKARLYHAKHGVSWEFTFKNIDVHGYTSVPKIPNQPNGFWVIDGVEKVCPIDPSADVNIFVFDQNEWATPPGSPFPLKPNTPTGSCTTYNNKPFVNIATFLSDHDNGQTAIQIAHELMHALVRIAGGHGIPINDVMDSYTLNSDWDAPGGNFAQQWILLAPFIASLFKPEVQLVRTGDDGVQTLGTLITQGFLCKTLELPNKNNAPNISCIPVGTYEVKWTFSVRLMKYTYEVQNVPSRSGIRFHSANYYSDLKGCIALGNTYGDINHDGHMDILNSRITIADFEKQMAKRPFILKIK